MHKSNVCSDKTMEIESVQFTDFSCSTNVDCVPIRLSTLHLYLRWNRASAISLGRTRQADWIKFSAKIHFIVALSLLYHELCTISFVCLLRFISRFSSSTATKFNKFFFRFAHDVTVNLYFIKYCKFQFQSIFLLCVLPRDEKVRKQQSEL